MFNKPIEIEYDEILQRYKIKNTRLTLEFVSNLIENGWSIKDIIKNYPQLDEEKIIGVLKYKNKNRKKGIKEVIDEIIGRWKHTFRNCREY